MIAVGDGFNFGFGFGFLRSIAGNSLCRLSRRGKQPVHPISRSPISERFELFRLFGFRADLPLNSVDADCGVPLENPHRDFIVVVRLAIGRGNRTKANDTAREFFGRRGQIGSGRISYNLIRKLCIS